MLYDRRYMPVWPTSESKRAQQDRQMPRVEMQKKKRLYNCKRLGLYLVIIGALRTVSKI